MSDKKTAAEEALDRAEYWVSATLDNSKNTQAIIAPIRAYIADLESQLAQKPIEIDISIGKWIPVWERLPEDYTKVLFFNADTQCHLIGDYCSKRKKWEYQFGRLVDEEDITHWMPLQAPPKE